MSFKRMKTNQHIEDQNWELLAKSLYDVNQDTAAENQPPVSAGTLSAEKEKDQVLDIAQKVDLYFDLTKYPADRAWKKVETRIKNQVLPKRLFMRSLLSNPLFRIAAAVLFAVLLGISGYEFIQRPSATAELLEISATKQVLNTFMLPDGTLVSLNTDTKINYPRKFGPKTREVTIEGEAFFEVKPNKNKPFIIHAGKAQIKVIGTSFNVSAYPDTQSVEVIVETGKVQVLNKTAETNELILIPGDKGTLVNSSNSLLKTTNQDPNFLAWKTRNLTFKATSLDEVIANLEKVYKVKIRLADPGLNELLLTARFDNYSLDFILKVIESTFRIEAKTIDGQYILKARS